MGALLQGKDNKAFEKTKITLKLGRGLKSSEPR